MITFPADLFFFSKSVDQSRVVNSYYLFLLMSLRSLCKKYLGNVFFGISCPLIETQFSDLLLCIRYIIIYNLKFNVNFFLSARYKDTCFFSHSWGYKNKLNSFVVTFSIIEKTKEREIGRILRLQKVYFPDILFLIL